MPLIEFTDAERKELLEDDRVIDLGPVKARALASFREALAGEIAAYAAQAPADVEVIADARLLRYMRACGYDLETAAAMYTATLQWRAENGVAAIRDQAVAPNYAPPHWHVVNRYWQIRPLYCYDATGSPVMIECIGRSDLKALLNDSGLSRQQLLTFWTHMMEWQMLLLDRLTLARGALVRKCEVRDLDGLGVAHTYKAGLDFFKECAAITAKHYVEIVRTVVIVNAPSVFQAVWKVLAGVIPESTKAKIHVCEKGPAAAQTLQSVIGPGRLPARYGGPDGHEMQWQTDAPCDHLGGPDGALTSLAAPGSALGAAADHRKRSATPPMNGLLGGGAGAGSAAASASGGAEGAAAQQPQQQQPALGATPSVGSGSEATTMSRSLLRNLGVGDAITSAYSSATAYATSATTSSRAAAGGGEERTPPLRDTGRGGDSSHSRSRARSGAGEHAAGAALGSNPQQHVPSPMAAADGPDGAWEARDAVRTGAGFSCTGRMRELTRRLCCCGGGISRESRLDLDVSDSPRKPHTPRRLKGGPINEGSSSGTQLLNAGPR